MLVTDTERIFAFILRWCQHRLRYTTVDHTDCATRIKRVPSTSRISKKAKPFFYLQLIRAWIFVNIAMAVLDTKIATLCDAVKKDQHTLVKSILDKGHSANAKDAYGNTPMYYAVSMGNLSMTSTLLENSACVNGVISKQGTALQVAVNCEDVDVVKYLLDNGADPLERGSGISPLRYAICMGYMDIVKTILYNTMDKYGPHALKFATARGNIPLARFLLYSGILPKDSMLHAAICSGSIKMVELLIRYGISCSRCLAVAAGSGNLKMVRLLLNNGCSIDDTDEDGNTALHIAVRESFTNITEFLLDNKCSVGVKNIHKESALCIAVYEGDMDTTILLLSRGADVNDHHDRGNTPLHIAVEQCALHIVVLLLGGGSCVNARNKRGETALCIAVSACDADIVTALLRHGADCNNAYGESPLCIATKKSNLRIAKMLLSSGAYVDARDEMLNTALHYALNSMPMVKLLVEYGADVMGGDGTLALNKAIIQNKPDVAEILIDKGATMNLPDGAHTVVLNGMLGVLSRLIKQGMSMGISDVKGDTLIHVAVRRNDVNMVLVLINNGVDTLALNREGKLALFYAGGIEVIRPLVVDMILKETWRM